MERVGFRLLKEGMHALLHKSLGFTSNNRFIATELFRMVQGPHSSGNSSMNASMHACIQHPCMHVCMHGRTKKGERKEGWIHGWI